VDDAIVCEMSYSWVDGAIFGRPDCGPLQFVTRNQSTRSDASKLDDFRRAFVHHSPSYFCFAALQGVAAAHRRPHVVGVRHDCQGAFEARYRKSFQRSYCEFWKAFSGVELDAQSFLIPVPLLTPPLSEIRAKHRKRALERRQLWSAISSSARAATLRHKVPRL
jgi:hypothetical protein